MTDDSRLTLTLGNNAEFNHRAGYPYPGPPSAQMALLWGGADKVVITPAPLPGPWVDDVCEALGYRSVTCVAPTVRTGRLSADLVADRDGLDTVADRLGGRTVEVSPRGVTPEVLDLAEGLERRGVHIDRRTLPARSGLRCIEEADSKLGGRAAATGALGHHAVQVPEGRACTRTAANELARRFMARDGQVVVKANFGSGGAGVRVVTSTAQLDRVLGDDAFWSRGPVLVEAFVGGAGSELPSFHGVVTDTAVEERAIGLQMMDGAAFIGCRCALDLLPPDAEAEARAASRALGGHLQRRSFRGWFNVDFLFRPETGALYFLEVNARRSGTSTAVDVGRQLAGGRWREHLAVQTIERLRLREATTLVTVLRKIRRMRQDLGPRTGIVLSIVAGLETVGEVGIVAWAPAADELAEVVRVATERVGVPVGCPA